MQFTSFIVALALATGISALTPAGSVSADSGSCREYTYCMNPTNNVGLLNVFGTDQDGCDSVGGDQYCCSQVFIPGSIISTNEMNNVCGLNVV